MTNEELKVGMQKMYDVTSINTRARVGYCVSCSKFVSDSASHKNTRGEHEIITYRSVFPGVKTKLHDAVIERTNKAKQLRAQGYTLSEIAKQIGASTGSVNYYLYGSRHSNDKKVGPDKTKHRIKLSVIGADEEVNGTPESEWHSGFATASVRFWLQDYAKEHGLELSTLTDSVVKNLKGR